MEVVNLFYIPTPVSLSSARMKAWSEASSDQLLDLSSRFQDEAAAAPFNPVPRKGERPGEKSEHIPQREQPEPAGKEPVPDEAAAEESADAQAHPVLQRYGCHPDYR